MNPAEPTDFPLGRWNLYIGGAGRTVDGCINLDLFAVPGVDVAADAENLPFRPIFFSVWNATRCWNTFAIPCASCARFGECLRPAATFIS